MQAGREERMGWGRKIPGAREYKFPNEKLLVVSLICLFSFKGLGMEGWPNSLLSPGPRLAFADRDRLCDALPFSGHVLLVGGRRQEGICWQL